MAHSEGLLLVRYLSYIVTYMWEHKLPITCGPKCMSIVNISPLDHRLPCQASGVLGERRYMLTLMQQPHSRT